MKVYAVFDTNILVSALISRRSDTAVVLALETMLSGEVIPLYNDEILQEYEEVLHREKFDFPESLVDAIICQIKKDGIASERIHTDETFPDLTDIVFYEVALSKEDSFLVTGNIKHFPMNPIVVTPSEFLKLIEKLE
ncbi:MAG: putative toxin-antitoxin system toxin component, PIN family [Bacteroidales bacterium]|nr:putative toxin-antitoxin system toxin component, PIN family [Bacteroidales bacterium]